MRSPSPGENAHVLQFTERAECACFMILIKTKLFGILPKREVTQSKNLIGNLGGIVHEMTRLQVIGILYSTRISADFPRDIPRNL